MNPESITSDWDLSATMAAAQGTHYKIVAF